MSLGVPPELKIKKGCPIRTASLTMICKVYYNITFAMRLFTFTNSTPLLET